ncbi:MAG: polyprenyl synthetase family protein [Muribaculaceae bacterium]|nr:polyprenyl synthetase family protein [Muribaculaceae bacterium]
MKEVKEYSLMVENAIKSLGLPVEKLDGLYSPIVYGMAEGGKRLRPVMTLMACEAFGADAQKAIHAGVGLEMYHNFTLLHDDVMDNSDVRRGRPTVHRKWDANTAILSGDTMLTLATQLMMRVDDVCLRSVLETFNDMSINVFEGQQWDMDFEKRDDVTLDEYMTMITGKTSALLGCAAKVGALIAGASAEDAQAMYDFGVSLGLAFQIKDDYLDVYGDPATFGKPIGGDILNNKKTYLMLLGLSSDKGDALREAMTLAASQEKIDAVRTIYNEAGIPAMCEAAIKDYSSAAVAHIESTSMSAEGKEVFKRLIDSLVGRTR